MQNNLVETLIGAIVVVVAGAFVYFAYTTTDTGSVSRGYEVKAVFAAADGINTGTDVRLHGIKIGNVSSMTLDPNSYQAVLTISIRNDIKIPDDSSVKVTSSGLLGSSYLSVQPGGSDKMLAAGGQITNTQGSVDLMGLISRAIYGNSSGSQ